MSDVDLPTGLAKLVADEEKIHSAERSLPDVQRRAERRRLRHISGAVVAVTLPVVAVLALGFPGHAPSTTSQLTETAVSPTTPSTTAPTTEASSPATPPKGPFLARCAHPSTYKPTTVYIACGDGGSQARDLTWQKWTPTEAVATGSLHERECVPTCLGGAERDYAATFDFSGLIDGMFTQVTIHFATTGPGGVTSLQRFL